MKNNKSHMLRLKNIGMLVLVPLAVLIVMECVSFLVSGKHVISSRVELYNLAKTTVQLALTALALSLNMSTGRMDFSLGAQQMIGCIVGGNLALRLGWGPAGVIVLSVAFGALSGLLVGLLFILTRIPSMVLGIGMALIYECICFAFSVDGLQLYGRTGMSILNDVWFQLLILAIVLTFYIIINARTKFGYHYKAIRGSQRIALSMGVNVNLNCLVCYTLAGGTIALAGVFSTAYNGVLASTMGMGSTSLAFTALLPVFVSFFLGRYTNSAVALTVGALSARLISVGLVQIAVPDPAVTVINYICLTVFLLVSNFTTIFAHKKAVKKRVALAAADEAASVG